MARNIREQAERDKRTKGVILESWEDGSSSSEADNEIRGVEAHSPQHLATELKDIASNGNGFATLTLTLTRGVRRVLLGLALLGGCRLMF